MSLMSHSARENYDCKKMATVGLSAKLFGVRWSIFFQGLIPWLLDHVIYLKLRRKQLLSNSSKFQRYTYQIHKMTIIFT